MGGNLGGWKMMLISENSCYCANNFSNTDKYVESSHSCFGVL